MLTRCVLTDVIAGIHNFEPVLKAKLHAEIDPDLSSWQIERRPDARPHHNRHRHHSRRRPGTGDASARPSYSSASGSSNGERAVKRISGQDLPSRSSSASSLYSLQRQQGHAAAPHGSTHPIGSASKARSTTSTSSHSRPHSPAQSSSSYELLAASTISFASRSTDPGLSATASPTLGYPDPGPLRESRTFGASSPRSDTLSVTDEGGQSPVSPGSPQSARSTSSRSSDPEEFSAMHSSVRFGTSSSSASHPSSGDMGDGFAARLVTVHLTKVKVGMWPSLISGPVPLSNASDISSSGSGDATAANEGIAINQRRARASSNSTIAEGQADGPLSSSPGSALSSSGTDDASTIQARRSSRLSYAESTLSLQSDDSSTILGPRRSSLEDAVSDEARFNMDPVSLVVIGLRIKAETSITGSERWNDAFEYFARSWRKVRLPVATEVLVQDYLPLQHPLSNDDEKSRSDSRSKRDEVMARHPFAPYRARMIAALGGMTALARLYVTFARLSLTPGQAADGRGSDHVYLFPSGSGHCRDPYSVSHYGVHTTAIRRRGSTSHPSTSSQHSSPRLGDAAELGTDAPHGGVPSTMSPAERTLLCDGPLLYFEEARRLEPAVQIEDYEWAEARRTAELAALEVHAEKAADEDAAFVFTDEEGRADKLARSTTRQQSRETAIKRRKKAKKGSSKGDGAGTSSSRALKRGRARGTASSSSAANDGGLVAVLSGAAIAGFVLAGSVAALGWWKRGLGSSSTTT